MSVPLTTAEDTLALQVGNPTASWNQGLFEAADKLSPYQDFYDVVGHGDPFRIGVVGTDVPLSARQLAGRIVSASDYWPGQGVRLVSCWSGAAEQGGFAEELAKELSSLNGLNTVTIGATGPISPLTDGNILIWTPKPGVGIAGPARWRFFDEGGPLMDTLGQKLP